MMTGPEPEPELEPEPGSCAAAGAEPAGPPIDCLSCIVCTASVFKKRFSASADPSRARRPAAIIDGLMEGWAALHAWQLAALAAERGDCVVNVGEDDETGNEHLLPLRTMLEKVAAGGAEAQSLYVFEPNLEARLLGLVDEHTVPPGYMDDDVLHLFAKVSPETCAEQTGSQGDDDAGPLDVADGSCWAVPALAGPFVVLKEL